MRLWGGAGASPVTLARRRWRGGGLVSAIPALALLAACSIVPAPPKGGSGGVDALAAFTGAHPMAPAIPPTATEVSVSPDGQNVAFVFPDLDPNGRPLSYHLLAGPVGGEARELLDTSAELRCITWQASGHELLVNERALAGSSQGAQGSEASSADLWQAVMVDVASARANNVGVPFLGGGAEVSPDGELIGVPARDPKTEAVDLEVVDVADGSSSVVLPRDLLSVREFGWVPGPSQSLWALGERPSGGLAAATADPSGTPSFLGGLAREPDAIFWNATPSVLRTLWIGGSPKLVDFSTGGSAGATTSLPVSLPAPFRQPLIVSPDGLSAVVELFRYQVGGDPDRTVVVDIMDGKQITFPPCRPWAWIGNSGFICSSGTSFYRLDL